VTERATDICGWTISAGGDAYAFLLLRTCTIHAITFTTHVATLFVHSSWACLCAGWAAVALFFSVGNGRALEAACSPADTRGVSIHTLCYYRDVMALSNVWWCGYGVGVGRDEGLRQRSRIDRRPWFAFYSSSSRWNALCRPHTEGIVPLCTFALYTYLPRRGGERWC